MRLRRFIAFPVVAAAAFFAGCEREADVASFNTSVAADNFEVMRRIVAINGITDKFLLTVEGRCSLGNHDKPRELTVTCKVGPSLYKKAFIGLSDNTTYVAEQIEPVAADPFHYRVVYRPLQVIPDIDVQIKEKAVQ